MSSLALDRGLELAGLFTAAELAAADLLLQLSGDDAAAPSASTTPSSSPGWVSPCREDLTVDEEPEEEERVVKEPAVSTELDRRARKRYRLLSDLYAGTIQVPVTSAAAAAEKRKTCDDDEDGESASSLIRGAGDDGGQSVSD